MHPVIFLALLVGVLLFISWYKRAPSSQQKRIRGRMLLFGGLGLVLLLLVTGHLNPIIAVVFAALAIGQRILAVANMANMFKGFRNSMKGAAGPSSGNVSDVETRYLRMSLVDKPGVLAQVCRCLGDYGVSIHQMRQFGGEPEPATVLITTHEVADKPLREALDSIAGLEPCLDHPVAMRILHP